MIANLLLLTYGGKVVVADNCFAETSVNSLPIFWLLPVLSILLSTWLFHLILHRKLWIVVDAWCVDLDLLPHGLWSGTTRLDASTHHGLRRWYLISFLCRRIDPPTNILLIVDVTVDAALSIVASLSINSSCQSILSLDATRSCPDDEASRCSSSCFYQLKTLLSFLLPPIQPSFFVVVLSFFSCLLLLLLRSFQ